MAEKQSQQEVAQMAMPFVAAMAEGKEVQVQVEVSGAWADKREVAFYAGCKYRIKPEPQYRPFAPEEAAKHLEREVKHKYLSLAPNKLTVISKTAVKVGGDSTWLSYCQLLNNYAFADDGTPCGVLVSE